MDQPGNLLPPQYSILIVGYRSLRFLRACFESLEALRGPRFEVLFLDNNSPEAEADFVEANFPHPFIRVFRSSENLFFTGGVNYLAARARGEFLALLNPDAYVDADWLAAMDAFFQATGYDVADPDVREASDPGRPVNQILCADPFGLLHVLPAPASSIRPIPVAGGCAMTIRKSVFLGLGGMDESFKMYFDEVDLCWRANLRGHRIGHVPEAVVYHAGQGSASAKSFFLWNRFRGRRNRIWGFLKNAGWPLLAVFIPVHLVLGLASVLGNLLRLRFRYAVAEAAALGAGFLGAWIPFSTRHAVQRTRLMSDLELFRREFFVLRLGFFNHGNLNRLP